MEIFAAMFTSVLENIVAEVIIVVIGVLFAYGIRVRWDKWRYGGWHVVIVEDNQILLDREISYLKAKEILSEPSELSVFLKGVVSPYGWINCDILAEGVAIGLLRRDSEKRTFFINLNLNPRQKTPKKEAIEETPVTGKHLYLHIQIDGPHGQTIDNVTIDKTELIL